MEALETLDAATMYQEARKNEASARALIEKRRVEIREEKKATLARLNAEDAKLKELLRVRVQKPRTPKAEAKLKAAK